MLELKLVIGALLMAGAFYGYHSIGERAVDQYKASQVEKQAEKDKLERERYDKIVGDYETLKAERAAKARTIAKTVTKIVERPIYINECVDSEGVDIMNKALKGE